MRLRIGRLLLRWAGVGTVALLMAAAVPERASAVVYRVSIQNLIPGGMARGQLLSPPVIVVHQDGYCLYAPGIMAGRGLASLARDGDPGPLAEEAWASPLVSSVIRGTESIEGTVVYEVQGTPGQLISIVTQLERTNDLVTGIHDVYLPSKADMVYFTEVYDAGVEENTGLCRDIDFYGGTASGVDEHDPVTITGWYSVMDDPSFGRIDYGFPPSAVIRIRTEDPVANEISTWGKVKSLF